MDEVTEPHESVEEMASFYASEVRARWPGNACVLVGICLGGWVAWEMAREPADRGGRADLLVLVDPGPPAAADGRRREFFAHYLDLLARAVAYHVRHRSLRRWISGRLRGEPFGVEKSLYRVALAHNNAAKRFRAQELDADVLLLQSSENRSLGERWRRLTRGAFDMVSDWPEESTCEVSGVNCQGVAISSLEPGSEHRRAW